MTASVRCAVSSEHVDLYRRIVPHPLHRSKFRTLGHVAPVFRAQHKTSEDRYEVLSEIAAGGMGVVYRVRDRVTGLTQAMKRLAANSPQQLLHAFEAEYHALASLHHPRIIRVYDYGVDARGPYYTMELLDGQDMGRVAPLLHRTACSYLRDIATSLALLHGRRLLHRDLSPSNVRVTPDGHCKLLDFGALTPFGLPPNIIGTPPLIPPEALRGGTLDQRSDLYSLGALAYWMLTGRHAYPARAIAELERLWTIPVAPPSTYASECPSELDALVMSMLNREPLARPGSAAEVISRLDVIGALDPEDGSQNARLAQSFFASPRFVGRVRELHTIQRRLVAAIDGKGGAVRIEGASGVGRSRLLEEIGVGARFSGATVVSVDASMARQTQGTAQSLVMRLFELLPDLTRTVAVRYRPALALLGASTERLLGLLERGAPEPQFANASVTTTGSLAELFVEISREQPLVITVDNIDEADDTSQGLVAAIASRVRDQALLLVATTTTKSTSSDAMGLKALRRHSESIELPGLATHEMTELCRSIFAEAPNVERFADWLHERAAGSPLHAIEICRQLLTRGVIRYASGLWTLPVERPNTELPTALGDSLALRLASLSISARELAECLSLQRDQPTLDLCMLLCSDAPDPIGRTRELLDELATAHVMFADHSGYRFSSSALRSALVREVSGDRLKKNHRRLGEAFAKLSDNDDRALQIEAGFHLIEGDDAVRGAEMIAKTTHESASFRRLVANLHRAGRPVEAAINVYQRHRRSVYERVPLLAALAQSGYYENRYFGERYGDEALDLLEDVCGLRSARRLRRYLGSMFALIFGVLSAYLRFKTTPSTQRPYAFGELFQHLFSTVTTITGTAALSLDATRAEKVAEVLEPFAFLPERMTPVGIHRFCKGLGEIAKENQAVAYTEFDLLLRRFSSSTYYPSLPKESRELFLAAIHFARGSFAVFRADGAAALESADALDATGLRLYAMIASQLRFLYYAARGEFAKGAPHRVQLELHAAHMGSVWQVETWEAAALILIHAVAIGDIVNSTRIVHRLEAISAEVPSLRRYSTLANEALVTTHLDLRYLFELFRVHDAEIPRSYIGWAASRGAIARSYNQLGAYAEGKAVADAALARIHEADLEFVALFLPLQISAATADAGLGNVEAGLARLDGLLHRFASCDHPLLHGLLHEARAYVCWESKRQEEYEKSVAEVDRWFRPTGTPALIAKYERLVALATRTKSERTLRPMADAQLGVDTELPTTLLDETFKVS